VCKEESAKRRRIFVVKTHESNLKKKNTHTTTTHVTLQITCYVTSGLVNCWVFCFGVSELVALSISTEWMIPKDRCLGNAVLLVLPT